MEPYLELIMAKLPPHTENFIKTMEALPKKTLFDTPIDEYRQGYTKFVEMCGAEYQDVYHVEDIYVESNHHKDPIMTRFYLPKSGAERLWVYVHGGGWCRGNVGNYDTHMRDIANRTGIAILSVEYGLAPEHRFPEGHQDVYDVFLWVKKHFQNEKGFKQVYLGGDSGGGNISAGTTCRLIEDNKPLPDAYIGIYPSLDFSGVQESYKTFAEGHILTAEAVKIYADHYILNPIHRYNFIASPMLYNKMEKFPRTIIVTAEADPLTDEQSEFCAKLQKAGVKVSQKIVPGVIHPFMILKKVFPEVDECIDWIGSEIRKS